VKGASSAGSGGAANPTLPLRDPAYGASGQDLRERSRRKFFQLVLLFVFSLSAGVLLAKSANGRYDASGPGTLDPNYTVETKTGSGGVVESTTYKVTYKFQVAGTQYTGNDSLSTEPTTADTTVYYMAGNPRESALHPKRIITLNLIAAGAAFLIGIVGYVLIPKNYPMGLRSAPQPIQAGIGDSGNEAAGMKRGKYGAWVYVHLAFFLQVGFVAFLAAWGLASVSGASGPSYMILAVATFVASTTTLWIYSDRWRCIETYSSQFCSGLANISVLYVPVVTIVYANYRGLKKLRGR